MTSKDVIVNDAAIRYFQAIYVGVLSDTHTFVLLFYEQVALVKETTGS